MNRLLFCFILFLLSKNCILAQLPNCNGCGWVLRIKEKENSVFWDSLFWKKQNNKFGLQSLGGRTLIPFEEDLNSEMVIIDSIIYIFHNNKLKAYSKSEKFLFPENQVFYINRISDLLEYDGFCTLKKEEKQFILDVWAGKMSIAFDGFSRYGTIDSKFFLVIKNNKTGCFDKKLVLRLPFEYDFIKCANIEEEHFIVGKNEKKGIVDINNKNIVSFKYDGMSIIDKNELLVIKNKQEGAINSWGKIIIPIEYESLEKYPNNKIYVASKKINSIVYYGVLDSLGNMILPFEYSHFEKHDNFFKASKKDKRGLFDVNIKTILPIVYDDILINSNNQIIAQKEGKTLLFDQNGKLSLSFNFDKLLPIPEGYLANKGKKSGILSKNFETILPIQYDEISLHIYDMWKVTLNNKQGFVKKGGKIVIPIQYKSIDFNTHNFFVATLNEQQGALDSLGKILIPFEYSEIEYDYDKKEFKVYKFNDEKLFKGTYNQEDGTITDDNEDNKFQVTTLNYDIIFKEKRDNEPFVIIEANGHYALVENETDGMMGMIDSEANIKIKPKYEGISFLKPEILLVNKKEKLGVINLKEEIILPFEFEDAGVLYDSVLFGKKEMTQKTSYFDCLGKPITYIETKKKRKPYEVESKEIEGVNQYYLHTPNGKVIPFMDKDPIKGVTNFQEGLLPIYIYKSHKFGYIDTLMNLVFEGDFEEISSFCQGLAIVKKDNHWCYVNQEGNVTIQTDFDEVRAFSKDNIAAVAYKNKWGFINKKGEIIVPLIFDIVEDYANGIAKVSPKFFDDTQEYSNRFFYLDIEGKILFKGISTPRE